MTGLCGAFKAGTVTSSSTGGYREPSASSARTSGHDLRQFSAISMQSLSGTHA